MARRDEEEAGLSMTPLIDIVLLLLVFYIVTTAFVDREVELQLPESDASAVPDEKKQLTIEVGVNGQLALNGETTTLALLDATIEAEAAADRIRSVEIRCDERNPFGQFVKVLGIVKKHGVEKVGIAVKQNQNASWLPAEPRSGAPPAASGPFASAAAATATHAVL
jgi:biopolymer transport protein ExbD